MLTEELYTYYSRLQIVRYHDQLDRFFIRGIHFGEVDNEELRKLRAFALKTMPEVAEQPAAQVQSAGAPSDLL